MDWLDYMTLGIILIVVIVNVFFLIWLAALPGQIARSRKHPQAEAIAALGWLSFLTMFATWPIAIVWAYVRPANVAVVADERQTNSSAS